MDGVGESLVLSSSERFYACLKKAVILLQQETGNLFSLLDSSIFVSYQVNEISLHSLALIFTKPLHTPSQAAAFVGFAMKSSRHLDRRRNPNFSLCFSGVQESYIKLLSESAKSPGSLL